MLLCQRRSLSLSEDECEVVRMCQVPLCVLNQQRIGQVIQKVMIVTLIFQKEGDIKVQMKLKMSF